MIRDMWKDGWAGGAMVFGFISLLILFVAGLWMAALEGHQWQAYAETHCKVVGQSTGNAVVTTTPVIVNGQVGIGIGTSYIPGKTGYLCDDGMTYWR